MLNVIAFLIVLCATIIGAGGIALMKKGADSLRLTTAHKNKQLIGGVALFIISTLCFITALKYGELHLLYALTGLTYVWLLLIAKHYLKEPITRTKIMGTALIITGVILIALAP